MSLTIQRLRRQLRHVGPARWQLIGGILAGVIYAATSGLGLPVLLSTTVPIFFGQEEDASPKVVAFAKSWFGDEYAGKLLILACIAVPVVFLVRGLSNFANRYLINYAGFVALENMRREVFVKLQNLPLAFYHQIGRAHV